MYKRQPSKSSELAKQTIVISGAQMKEPICIKLSAIHTHENWMIISHALTNFAKHISIDDGIAKALTLPSADTSFTELWLDSLSSAPEVESLQEIPDGQTLAAGRYLVKSKLASGGQGHAYLCYDQTTQEEVVVKAYLLPVYCLLYTSLYSSTRPAQAGTNCRRFQNIQSALLAIVPSLQEKGIPQS